MVAIAVFAALLGVSYSKFVIGEKKKDIDIGYLIYKKSLPVLL